MTKGGTEGRTKGRVRLLTALALVFLLSASAREAAAQARGVQFTPDGKRILVNKDVGTDRYAISKNQDSNTITGNVFRSDGGPPAFLYCFPLEAADTYSCWGADACTQGAGGPQRGIQRTSSGIILVNKDVGTERYAIGLNTDATATGNVFRADGGPPAFIFCTPGSGANMFSCSGADTCITDTCSDQFTFIADVTLPGDFFEVPDPCDQAFTFVAEVTLLPSFFVPPEVITFTLNASAPLQGFTLNATYPTSKGGISGSHDIAGCSSTATNFVQNDQDDGNLILVAGSASPLTFPIEIKCAYDEIEGQNLVAEDIAVEVKSVTQNASLGDPDSLSVGVSVTP